MGSMTGMYKGGRGEIYFKAAWWRARVSARHQVLLSRCNCQIPRREVERWRSTFWCTVECWGGESPGVALLCRMQYSTQCSSVALYVKQQCNGATGTFPIPGEVLVHRSACCLVLLSVAQYCFMLMFSRWTPLCASGRFLLNLGEASTDTLLLNLSPLFAPLCCAVLSQAEEDWARFTAALWAVTNF